MGVTKKILESASPRINEQPFDSGRKMMTTVHKDAHGKVISYTKGAMDRIIINCTHILEEGRVSEITEQDRQNIADAAKQMATMALRVLALAVKMDDDSATEDNLTFVGMVGMIDPPRLESAGSVEIFKNA